MVIRRKNYFDMFQDTTIDNPYIFESYTSKFLMLKTTLYPAKLIACNIEDTLILIERLYSTYAYHKI